MGAMLAESHGLSTAAGHVRLEPSAPQKRLFKHETAPFPHLAGDDVSGGGEGQAAIAPGAMLAVTIKGVSSQHRSTKIAVCTKGTVLVDGSSHSRSLSVWLQTSSSGISSAVYDTASGRTDVLEVAEPDLDSQAGTVLSTNILTDLPHTAAAQKLVADLRQAENHNICVHTGVCLSFGRWVQLVVLATGIVSANTPKRVMRTFDPL